MSHPMGDTYEEYLESCKQFQGLKHNGQEVQPMTKQQWDDLRFPPEPGVHPHNW